MTRSKTVETLFQTIFHTKVGNMKALATSNHLIALEYDHQSRLQLLEKRLQKYLGTWMIQEEENPILAMTKTWLDAYFSQDFSFLQKLPAIALCSMGSDFEKKVWSEMKAIPLGKTISYQKLAEKIKCPLGSRAVGNASRKNPLSLIVPCHRVVGSHGELTGYGGGVMNKEWLLKHEGFSK